MPGGRRGQALKTAAVVAVVAVVVMLITSRVLASVLPDQHDLSDIGTGFERLLLTGLAGVLSAFATWLVVRATVRRRAATRSGQVL